MIKKKLNVENKWQNKLILIDEILTFRQLLIIPKLLKNGNTVALATHIHPFFYQFFRIYRPIAVFNTNKSKQKIIRFLQGKNISFSEDAIRRYFSKYGTNYTDIQIILERYPQKSFDKSLFMFEKFCELE